MATTFDALVMRVLTEEVGKMAQTARNNAGWSSKIPSAISVTNAETDGQGTYKISIEVDIEKAPIAGAFEFGSGLHSQTNPGLYPIKAKNVDNLKFFWAKQGHWFYGPQLPYGHPGVVARPYLEPAVRTNLPSLTSRLPQAIGQAFVLQIRESYKNVRRNI